jgi:hypothetical protein
MKLEKLQESLRTVKQLNGTYDMDSDKFYNALGVVMDYAKQKLEEETRFLSCKAVDHRGEANEI